MFKVWEFFFFDKSELSMFFTATFSQNCPSAEFARSEAVSWKKCVDSDRHFCSPHVWENTSLIFDGKIFDYIVNNNVLIEGCFGLRQHHEINARSLQLRPRITKTALPLPARSLYPDPFLIYLSILRLPTRQIRDFPNVSRSYGTVRCPESL